MAFLVLVQKPRKGRDRDGFGVALGYELGHLLKTRRMLPIDKPNLESTSS